MMSPAAYGLEASSQAQELVAAMAEEVFLVTGLVSLKESLGLNLLFPFSSFLSSLRGVLLSLLALCHNWLSHHQPKALGRANHRPLKL